MWRESDTNFVTVTKLLLLSPDVTLKMRINRQIVAIFVVMQVLESAYSFTSW